MLKTKQVFKGANVFMSRNLVPPEIFDKLHDTLRHNGAEIFLCCDPSRNGPNDYHVISSPDHEKFEDLKAKGCNLLGPHCVISCLREQRALPQKWFTCCLAMDGVKLLASGFEMKEKQKIMKLVTAMGGVLHTKASLDVSFVIVKDVLAPKYKWALYNLRKPIVTVNWLYQCWNEHRVVPHNSYRVLPFSGLTICITRIPSEKRKEMEKLITQYGGKYSADLTKDCTHLISDAPEGDKYKVARKWGQIHIVTPKWLDQSISRRACLNEESYPVKGGTSIRTRYWPTEEPSLENNIEKQQYLASFVAADSNIFVVPCTQFFDRDEAPLSQNMSSTPDAVLFVEEADIEATPVQPNVEIDLDGAVADDSESDDNDLYLSECRILLVGFEVSQMRRLVSMIRRGGGSRCTSLNDMLTHIIIGTPSEVEKKDLRSLAATGVIYVVSPSWLEDCDRQKKEVPVLKRHIIFELFQPKDSVCISQEAVGSMTGITQGKNSTVHQRLLANKVTNSVNHGYKFKISEKNIEEKPGTGASISSRTFGRSTEKTQVPVLNDTLKDQQKMQPEPSVQYVKSSFVFKGRIFCFSNSFPDDRRFEILQWVNQGGGELVDDHTAHNVHFTIECHGVRPRSENVLQSTLVSSHWIRSCLEEGSLLNIDSHILYSPLPCCIPLPGFGSLRFCVSQYEERERVLLKNLCFVLGAKFAKRLTKKVTHLLCKFTNGPKYEAACKWGINSVTSDWIIECIKQNGVVPLDPFLPNVIGAEDQEVGYCITTQFPSQATQMICEEDPFQFPSQSQDLKNTTSPIVDIGTDNSKDEAQVQSSFRKKARISEGENQRVRSVVNSGHPIDRNSIGDMLKEDLKAPTVVPDFAAAIEDLLEQADKIHDQKSPGSSAGDKAIFLYSSSNFGQDHPNAHSGIGPSEERQSRNDKVDDCSASREGNATNYDGYSEPQTDSQVVGYEEDLSGRQMLIDRIRTQCSLTPDSN